MGLIGFSLAGLVVFAILVCIVADAAFLAARDHDKIVREKNDRCQ